ncbi:MAG: hypothetical protein U1E91_04905 [Moraxella sp.]
MTTSTNKIIDKLATGILSALLITNMPMTVAMQSAGYTLSPIHQLRQKLKQPT